MHKKLSLGLCFLLAAEPALAAPCGFEGNGPMGGAVVVYNSPSGTNSTAAITTTQSNEPIFLTFFASSEQAAGPGPVVTGISGGGLTFTKRAGLGGQVITACVSGGGQNCVLDFEVWEAEASAPLASQAFAVSATTGGATGAILAVFGLINTVSPSSPWDSNGSLPATTADINGSGSVPNVTGVSTSNANDIILQFCGTGNNIGLFSCNDHPSAGWAVTASATFLNSFTDYQIGSGVYYETVSTTLSGVTLNGVAAVSGGANPTTSTLNWINFGDAIKCSAPAPPPTGAIPHVWVNE